MRYLSANCAIWLKFLWCEHLLVPGGRFCFKLHPFGKCDGRIVEEMEWQDEGRRIHPSEQMVCPRKRYFKQQTQLLLFQL